MKCIIACNGSGISKELINEFIKDDVYLICADGGANHLRRFGIVPDILLGDFDSIDTEILEFYRSQNVEILSFPPEKDYTDSELSIEIAIRKGFKDIVILGGIGSRIDHSLANIYLLKKVLEVGCNGVIVNDNNRLMLTTSYIEIEKMEDYKVTLLPLTDKVTGVTTKGLYYPLSNYTLTLGSTLGVSNEFASDKAAIIIESGILMVIMSKD